MGMFDQDLILRAVEAIGRALAGLVLRDRVGIQVPGRDDEAEVDAWLRRVPLDQLRTLRGADLADAAKLRSPAEFVAAIHALEPSADHPEREARVAVARSLKNELIRRFSARLGVRREAGSGALLLSADAGHRQPVRITTAELDPDVVLIL